MIIAIVNDDGEEETIHGLSNAGAHVQRHIHNLARECMHVWISTWTSGCTSAGASE